MTETLPGPRTSSQAGGPLPRESASSSGQVPRASASTGAPPILNEQRHSSNTGAPPRASSNAGAPPIHEQRHSSNTGAAPKASNAGQQGMKGAINRMKNVMRMNKSDFVYSPQELVIKLHQAAAQCRTGDLRTLISGGSVDVNAQDAEGRTALIYAACKGHAEAVSLLLSAKAQVNIQDDYGTTALHHAAALLDESALKALLHHGADPMLKDAFGRTALSAAVQAAPRKSDKEAALCIAQLVKAASQLRAAEAAAAAGGANVGPIASARPDPALVSYCLSVGDYPVTIGVLAEMGAQINEADSQGRIPLYHALIHSRPGSVKELLSRGSSWLVHEPRQLSVLHVVALQGNMPVCRAVLDAARRAGVLGDLLRLRDSSGMQPLDLAAAQGHVETVRALVASGADVDARHPTTGMSPIFFAAMSCKAACADALLKLESKVSGPQAIDRLGRTALHAACAADRADDGMAVLVKAMIQGGVDVHVADAPGRLTALHLAAMKGSTNLCKLLLEAGANPLALDKAGRTPILHAAATGFIDAFSFLADRMRAAGYDPASIVDGQGRSALHLAAQGRPELLATLLESGFEPLVHQADRAGECTPLHLAAEAGDPDCVALLVDSSECRPNARDQEGRTALHYASAGGHVGCIRILLDRGGDIRARSLHGYTALHAAAEAGNAQSCLLLCREGSDLAATIVAGSRTALHLAAGKGHTLAALSLVRMGADVRAQDALGRTPLALALAAGFKECGKAMEDESRRVVAMMA